MGKVEGREHSKKSVMDCLNVRKLADHIDVKTPAFSITGYNKIGSSKNKEIVRNSNEWFLCSTDPFLAK